MGEHKNWDHTNKSFQNNKFLFPSWYLDWNIFLSLSWCLRILTRGSTWRDDQLLASCSPGRRGTSECPPSCRGSPGSTELWRGELKHNTRLASHLDWKRTFAKFSQSRRRPLLGPSRNPPVPYDLRDREHFVDLHFQLYYLHRAEVQVVLLDK